MDSDEFTQAQELLDLRDALRRAQQRADAKERKTAELVAAVYQAARDAGLAQPLRSVPKPPKKAGPGSPHVALLHTTDWQCGKRTSSFGIDVLERRLAETNLVLEQQDRDLARQRKQLAALESGHAEMQRNCAQWHAGCAERDVRITALESGLREALALAAVPLRHQSDAWYAAQDRLRALVDDQPYTGSQETHP